MLIWNESCDTHLCCRVCSPLFCTVITGKTLVNICSVCVCVCVCVCASAVNRCEQHVFDMYGTLSTSCITHTWDAVGPHTHTHTNTHTHTLHASAMHCLFHYSRIETVASGPAVPLIRDTNKHSRNDERSTTTHTHTHTLF